MTEMERYFEYVNRLLKENNVTEFPTELTRLTEEDFCIPFYDYREDFRDKLIFTIDSAHTKDIDDAISLEILQDGYLLGVHIADVSEYVSPDTQLDVEAQKRGTSIYIPGMTIPMLPEILTNNLCSLVEGRDRNTLSVLIHLDKSGNVLNYRITKAVIRSRVKGIYHEVNKILQNTATNEIISKYADVIQTINNMNSLAKFLRAKRIESGAYIYNNSSPEVTFVKDRIWISPHKNEDAEEMIEEFMVLTNYLVSLYMIEHNLPTIFRVQKNENSLAEYRSRVNPHYSLALPSYCHFTSPIRRYADLIVHRSLNYHLAGYSAEQITAKMGINEMIELCELLTRRNHRADNLQYVTEKYCYVAFFNWECNKRFYGTVTKCTVDNCNTIIHLDDYNLKVLGKIALNRYIGKSISFRLEVRNGNKLCACDVKILAS